jgi:hypothetical protein
MMLKTKFVSWWIAVNQELEDQGLETLSFRHASTWWTEGATVAEAVERHLENLESSQEERSYYDA